MSKQKQLIPVTYSDSNSGIYLSNFADTLVYSDAEKGKTLCAIRLGGYPEQVEAMASAIYGGGTVSVTVAGTSLLLNTLAKRYRKKVTHDGVYAEATLVAEDDISKADDESKKQDKGDKKTKKSKVPEETEDEEQPELAADLPPRSTYIYIAPDDKDALFTAIDSKTATPLIPEFAGYLIDALIQRGDLRKLHVHSVSTPLEAWVLKCAEQDKNIIAVVEDGLKSGAIAIPCAISSAPMPQVNSVTEYLTAFGPNIAERIKAAFVPLFDPAHEALSPEVLAVNEVIREKAGYPLYDAQLAVAEAIKRQLEVHKAGLIIAECGAGKTKIGLVAIAAATAGLLADQRRRKKTKTFNIVLCPAHVAEKWCREIAETLPNTDACIVKNPTGFDRLFADYTAGTKSVYAIISKETARDGYMHAPAVTWNKRKSEYVCPDCGEPVMMSIMLDGTPYVVSADQFYFKNENRFNHKCEECGTNLWTALNSGVESPNWVKVGGYGFVFKPRASEHLLKTKNPEVIAKINDIMDGIHRTRGAHRKYPLSSYIKNRYARRIDAVIVDELHQYSNDSGQGDAMAELYNAAKKVIGMTATLINGYASGIFHLLYRLVPGLMELDGQSHSAPSAFASEYGVVQNTYEIQGGDYNTNRRTVKTKKRSRPLPGVSPLVYSRFLLEYAAFLSLTDMGKDLPEYEEIPVSTALPKEIQKVYNDMQEMLRAFMKSDKKAANKILSAYLNLLTAFPDQPYNLEPIYHPIDGYEIVTPPDMGDIDTVMPKDNVALGIVNRKVAAGENVLIYTNWTRLDSQQKLLKRITAAGHRAAILPATVPPVKREKWVQDRLDEGLQVLICNPLIVETGLDLNAFTTLIFFDVGTKLFTLRQASRRSWRINQTAPRVEVYMLYYADTMQHKALKLMGTKLAVAAIIEGGFSEEGLSAMSQCDDMTSMMAKELMLGIKDSVEDVSSSFKKMAFLKPKTQTWEAVVFTDEPTELPATATAPQLVEFSFAQPGITTPPQAVPPKKHVAEVKHQITLFDYIEEVADHEIHSAA